MYASKRFAYTPPVYKARCQLAALDYNNHLDRPVQINKNGEVRYLILIFLEIIKMYIVLKPWLVDHLLHGREVSNQTISNWKLWPDGISNVHAVQVAIIPSATSKKKYISTMLIWWRIICWKEHSKENLYYKNIFHCPCLQGTSALE